MSYNCSNRKDKALYRDGFQNKYNYYYYYLVSLNNNTRFDISQENEHIENHILSISYKK